MMLQTPHPSLRGLNWPVLIAAASTLIALIGLFWKYFSDLAMQRRKDKLERLNLQLKRLYGPLYAAVHTGEHSWLRFRELYRPNLPYFGGAEPPKETDLEAWRLWMTEVFMPINLRMEATIVENADLLIEETMPPCFLLLCAHVAAYKPILKRWERNDYSEHVSISVYPRGEMMAYIDRSFLELKRQQSHLLGRMRLRTGHTGATSPTVVGIDEVEAHLLKGMGARRKR